MNQLNKKAKGYLVTCGTLLPPLLGCSGFFIRRIK